jgi:hypothetical protein
MLVQCEIKRACINRMKLNKYAFKSSRSSKYVLTSNEKLDTKIRIEIKQTTEQLREN